jgi:thiamine pyrophosphate-dependent acetolactate synthase large subunit-like protein
MATMIWPLRRGTEVAADGVAVRCGAVRLTFAETWDRCRRLIGGLRQLGVGDGSSLYSIQALWTAAQHRLPITFVVLNNRGYAALKAFGRVMGLEQPPGVDLPGIGIPEIAAGFGCPASRVDRADQLEPALRSSFASGGPALVDVGVDSAIESLY